MGFQWDNVYDRHHRLDIHLVNNWTAWIVGDSKCGYGVLHLRGDYYYDLRSYIGANLSNLPTTDYDAIVIADLQDTDNLSDEYLLSDAHLQKHGLDKIPICISKDYKHIECSDKTIRATLTHNWRTATLSITDTDNLQNHAKLEYKDRVVSGSIECDSFVLPRVDFAHCSKFFRLCNVDMSSTVLW